MLTEKSKPDFGFLHCPPRKFISFWEMIEFCATGLVASLNWLQEWEDHSWIQTDEEGAESKIDANLRATLDKGLASVESQCRKMELPLSLSLCHRLSLKLTKKQDLFWNVIESELEGIRTSIRNECLSLKAAFIPRQKARFFQKDSLFGDLVNEHFPELKDEIKEAGNCIAADLNTAAVFHLMRVAEFGLRKLSKGLRVKLPCQIEFSTWGNVMGAIDDELKKIKSTPRTKARDKKLQFYSQLLLDIKAFQYLWRDPVSHTRNRYDELQAQSAFNHVCGFLQKMTEKF